MIAYTHLFGNKNRLAVKQWFPTFLMPRPFNTVPPVVVTPLPCLEEDASPLWQATATGAIENSVHRHPQPIAASGAID